MADKARRELLQPVMNYWIPRLGLADWDITWNLVNSLDGDPMGGGVIACRVYHAGPYQKAHVSFVRSQLDNAGTAYERELMVLHELIHIVMHPLQTLQQRLFGPGDVCDQFRWAEEQVVDGLTVTLYRLRHNMKPTALYV